MPAMLGIAIVITSLSGSHTLRPHTHRHLQNENRYATDHLLKSRAAPAYFPKVDEVDCRTALSSPPAVLPDSRIQFFWKLSKPHPQEISSTYLWCKALEFACQRRI